MIANYCRTYQNHRDLYVLVWWPLCTRKEIDLFTPIPCNLAIWLADLPLSIGVKRTLLASRCHAMPFSALKHFLFCWYGVKKQIDCGLALSVLLLTTIFVITMVKICCGLTRVHNIFTTMLSIRAQTTLNHIRFFNLCKDKTHTEYKTTEGT